MMLRSRKWCAPLRGDLRFPKVVLAPCLTPASAKEYRSLEVKHEFQRQHPCPSTGSPTSRCPVYIKDHVVPLAVADPTRFPTCNGRRSAPPGLKTSGSGKVAGGRGALATGLCTGARAGPSRTPRAGFPGPLWSCSALPADRRSPWRQRMHRSSPRTTGVPNGWERFRGAS
jgi:hypothetical protein